LNLERFLEMCSEQDIICSFLNHGKSFRGRQEQADKEYHRHIRKQANKGDSGCGTCGPLYRLNHLSFLPRNEVLKLLAQLPYSQPAVGSSVISYNFA
jgi:hypothetical protein